jgi:hypothetical protein
MFIDNEDATIRYYVLQFFQAVFFYQEHISEKLNSKTISEYEKKGL